MAEIVLKNVKKIYPNAESKSVYPGGRESVPTEASLQITEEGVVAVQDFSLTIADKEFVVLVGPSGCGKSTTLRMIAGLEEVTEGELYIDGKKVNHVPPLERDVAMVFQNYALFPHMTVYDNMAFALKMHKFPKAEIDRRVREAAEILDLTDYLRRKPKALSGGQRQRVAIGRAIVCDAKAFLMDEPLSNLDAKLRNHMRMELVRLRRKLDSTFVYVTHDQTEAMTLGDRIVIMKDGFVQQVGTPAEVFDHPANLFVAGFIGLPPMNLLHGGMIVKREDVCGVALGEAFFPLSEDKQSAAAAFLGREVVVGVRPVHILPGDVGLPATVTMTELLGSESYVHLDVAGEELIAVVRGTADGLPPVEQSCRVMFHAKGLHLFDPETEENLF